MKNLKIWCCTICTFVFCIFLVLATTIAIFFLINWINTIIPNSIIIYASLHFSNFVIESISKYVNNKINNKI